MSRATAQCRATTPLRNDERAAIATTRHIAKQLVGHAFQQPAEPFATLLPPIHALFPALCLRHRGGSKKRPRQKRLHDGKSCDPSRVSQHGMTNTSLARFDRRSYSQRIDAFCPGLTCDQNALVSLSKPRVFGSSAPFQIPLGANSVILK